jgi:K+-transporting ATPase ATPase B chain
MNRPDAVFVPFTAQTRMSGVDSAGRRNIRKGAAESVSELCPGMEATSRGRQQDR